MSTRRSPSPDGAGDYEDQRLPDGTRLGDALAEGRASAWWPWTVAVLILLGGLVSAVITIPTLPDQVPTGFGPRGEARGWTETTFISASVTLLVGAGLTVFMALISAMVPVFSTSDPAQRSFWEHFRLEGSHRGVQGGLGWLTAVMNVMMIHLMVEGWSIARQQSGSEPTSQSMWMILIYIVLMFVVMVPPFRRWSRWSREAAARHGVHLSAEDEAEEERWLPLGLLNDPDDPRLFPPKRDGYGTGLTFNVGHAKGRLVLVAFLAIVFVPLIIVFVIAANQ